VANDRIGTDVLERVLSSALARYPDAPVAALGPDGWFVDPPASFPTGTRTVLVGETALDLVVVEDRAAVVSAWARARATGASQVMVHTLAEPDETTLLQFTDARERHGVFILIMVVGGVVSAELGGVHAGPLKPRYCQMRRSELAFVLEADEASERMFGWPADSMVGRRSIELVHPEDHERAIDNWLEMLGGVGRAARWRGRYLNADGSWTWVEITNHNRLQDPEFGDVLTEMVNIDDEMLMHEALRAREELIRGLTAALPVGVLQVDRERTVVFTNPRLHEILGAAAIITFDHVRALVSEADAGQLTAGFAAVLDIGAERDLEVRLRPVKGEHSRVCQLNLRPLRAATGEVTGAIACVTDVTDSVLLREELQLLATYDDLTGVHNRASTLRQLAHLLGADIDVGIVYIDLDEFKPVNDHYGHRAGDEMLKAVARRLRSCVRRSDVVGRIGGDEFVVLHPGVVDLDELGVLADRLRGALEADVVVTDQAVVAMRASLGVKLARGHDDADHVLAQADAAMYAAKRARRDAVV